MHPTIPRPTLAPDLGHRILRERSASDWHAVLYRRVRRSYGEDLDPVREWRLATLTEVTEAIEAAAPGVDALVLVEA